MTPNRSQLGASSALRLRIQLNGVDPARRGHRGADPFRHRVEVRRLPGRRGACPPGPDDEEHADLLEWVGGSFDPAEFDVAKFDVANANALLQKVR
jgi:hypothetical protein